MNEAFLLWGFGLFGIALALFFVEVFLPSGGVIGALVGVAAIAGVVSFFRASTMWGFSSLLALIVVSPIAFAFALKIWPNTPIGKRLILGSVDDNGEIDAPPPTDPQADFRAALLGATGVAMTDLRPVGFIKIEGERIEALAETGVIRAGANIRITGVEDNQIKVRAAK